MTRHHYKFSAFTLVEVLAALALVGIVLPVTMHALTLSLAASSNARHQAEAAQLAELKVNELLVHRDASRLSGQGDFGEAWPQYRWRSTAAQRDYGLFEVTVTVQWPQRGRERSLSLATLVYTAHAAELE